MEGTAVIQHFRTAVGGFNRRDVQEYIGQITAAHRQETEKLQKRAEQAESRAAELETAISEAETARDSAAQEAVQVKSQLDESARTVARLRGDLSQMDAKLRVAKQELERLQAHANTLEPMANSYVQLKDRVASVELDAHRKAQDTVSQAQAEAERIRTDVRKWLDQVLDQYSQLREGLDAMLAQAQALSAGAQQLELLDEAAQAIQKQGGAE